MKHYLKICLNKNERKDYVTEKLIVTHCGKMRNVWIKFYSLTDHPHFKTTFLCSMGQSYITVIILIMTPIYLDTCKWSSTH